MAMAPGGSTTVIECRRAVIGLAVLRPSMVFVIAALWVAGSRRQPAPDPGLVSAERTNTSNTSPLDLSVNRSLGAQIGWQLGGVLVGRVIGVGMCQGGSWCSRRLLGVFPRCLRARCLVRCGVMTVS
jgi:hypothetical protein